MFQFQEDQYAKWMAACRLASKGRSLADSSYDSEVASIKSFLSMQKPAHAPPVSINPDSIQPNDFLSQRICKKLKGKVCYNIRYNVYSIAGINCFVLLFIHFVLSNTGNRPNPRSTCQC